MCLARSYLSRRRRIRWRAACRTRRCTARLRPARLRPARLGPAGLGPARLRPTRLGRWGRVLGRGTGRIEDIHHQPIAHPKHPGRRACQQSKVQQAGMCDDRSHVMRWTDRWRDGHVIGEPQRLMVAVADLLIRNMRAKFEDEPSEPRMIAGPRRDGRGGIDRRDRFDRRGVRSLIRRRRRPPQDEGCQNGEPPEWRAERSPHRGPHRSPRPGTQTGAQRGRRCPARGVRGPSQPT